MTPAQTKETLAVFGKTFSAEGCTSRGMELTKLAALFADVADRTTLLAFIKKIETNWKAGARSPRHPNRLKSVLESIKEAFASAGAVTPAKDIDTLLRLFLGTED